MIPLISKVVKQQQLFAFVYIVYLLYLYHCIRIHEAFLFQMLKKFQLITERHTVLSPRLYHLQAYFAYLQGKASSAKMLLDNCLIAGRSIGPMFEVGWAISSRSHWFSANRLAVVEAEYEGRSAYTLPRY